MADGYAGVAFRIVSSSGMTPMPESTSGGIATYARGQILLATVAAYNSLLALKSKVSVREIPWRNTIVVDVGVGPGAGALTWRATVYSAILTGLGAPTAESIGSAPGVLAQAEFLIV